LYVLSGIVKAWSRTTTPIAAQRNFSELSQSAWRYLTLSRAVAVEDRSMELSWRRIIGAERMWMIAANDFQIIQGRSMCRKTHGADASINERSGELTSSQAAGGTAPLFVKRR
jgi:hypothetical protein